MSVSTNGQIGHAAGKDLTGGVPKSGPRNVPYGATDKVTNESVTAKAPGKYGKPGPDYSGKFMPTHKNAKSGSYGSAKCGPK